MELFPDGGFVRLQSRANSKYIHADGDWKKVSLRTLSTIPSLEAVWRVEHWVSNQGQVYVLFQNAAYGRYLSFSHQCLRGDPFGHRVIQRDYDDPNLVDAFLWRWRAERVDPDQDHVRLRHFNFHLRANDRYLTCDDTRVIADDRDWFGVQLFTMMPSLQWTVHAVAATPLPLPLPVTAPFPPPVRLNIRRGSRMFWDLWRFFGYGPGVYEDVPREIRYVRANAQGNFDQNHWRSFVDHDLPVVELWRYLAILQDDWTGDMLDFTLCIRPGSHGRLMPLVTHLPRSQDPLNIVVLRTGSPAAAALVYPLLYA